MAENRGNPSGSKSNLPNTRPDGVTRPNNRNSDKDSYDTYKPIDTKTLKEMRTVYKGLTKFAIELGGNLKDFNEVIEKSANNIVNTRQKLDKTAKEYDAEVAEMKKHYFGANKKIADDYEKFVEEKKQLMEKEFEETRKEEQKNIIKQSFKNESKRNEIKFMNNKFSKGNNLASTSNEYYSQLEKLKSDALDTFEDGLNNKEYKKALMNLNDKYAQDMKEAWKEDFKENHKVLGGIASGIKDTFNKNKETLQGLLGPLNLFIAPLKDFFGGFGAVFKFIGGGIKTIFRKFTKKNPTASDVLKTGAYGVGSLFIGNKLDDLFGKTKKEGVSSIFDNLIPKDIKELLFGKNSGLWSSLKTISSMAGGLMIIGDFITEFAKSGDWRKATAKAITGSSKLENGIKGGLIGFSLGGPLGALLGIVAGIGLNMISPQVEDFIRVMTGDKAGKRNIHLNELKEKVKKGKMSQEQLDYWTRITQNLSDDDYNKLVQGLGGIGNLFESDSSNTVDWIRAYASGKFDNIKGEDAKTLMKYMYTDKTFNKLKESGWNMSDFDIHTNVLTDALSNITNSNYLASIIKDEKSLSQFLRTVVSAKTLQGDELHTFMKKSGLTESQLKLLNETQFMQSLSDYHIDSFNEIIKALDPKNKSKYIPNANTMIKLLSDSNSVTDVNDAIIRADGSIIKTNPQDTLVALKNIPLSMEQVRSDTTKNLNTSLSNLGTDKTLEKKLTTIIEVLSKILAKDVQVNLPPQTRSDLDIIMNGGMI